MQGTPVGKAVQTFKTSETTEEGAPSLNERLRAIIDMRSHLQSNIAHELRTPLSAIRGYTRMLLDGRAGEITNTQKEYLTVVTDNTNRLIHLVSCMSQLSDLGPQYLNLTAFDLKEVWTECRKSNDARLLEQATTVVEHIPSEPFVLMGDREKFANVFQILLSSAANFAGRDGQISVHFSRGRENELIVRIAQTGQAIPPETLRKIVDRSPSLPLRGTTSEFDLSMVQDVVSLHGGRLFANSKAGVGSTFILTLPFIKKNSEENLGHEQTVNSGRRRR
jgi:two-component system OmpR family sensor kinase